MIRLRKIVYFTLLLELFVCVDGFAAKKDFKGLFGSYRREKFTENEGASGELGVDLMFSTLMPITPVIQSQEATGGAFSSLNYATFFNVEGGLHYSLTYNWLLYASIGYYDYDTRKKTASSSDKQPNFHQFEMRTIPMLLGVKYRFTSSDVVPYLGIGAGVSAITQKGFYDSAVQNRIRSMTVPTGQIVGGFEFYFAAKAGIRMEIAAYFMKIDSERWNEDGASAGPVISSPAFEFSANVWSVRYASGLFFVF